MEEKEKLTTHDNSIIKQNKDSAFARVCAAIKNIASTLRTHVIKNCKKTGAYFNQLRRRLQNNKLRRRDGTKKSRILQKLPWFLILGEEHSGKKLMLANSGLTFIRPEIIGAEALYYKQEFPDYDFWITEKNMLIDTLSYDEEQDKTNWKKFIKLLAQERKNKPINGVIITIRLPSLLRLSTQERQDFIQSIGKYIRTLHEKFRVQVPVYLVCTHCDKIEGFMEFFNDLSKEELEQLWGMSFPLENCKDATSLSHHFNHQYAVLMAQLRKRVLWSFDTERSDLGWELINNFPQQMQLLKKPLETFMLELLASIRHNHALLLRGIYFTSATQTGETHSFLQEFLSQKFQLVHPQTQNTARMRESYFLKRLLPDIIFPQGQFLGQSEQRLKTLGLCRAAFKITFPIIIVLTVIITDTAYKNHQQRITHIEQAINDYESHLEAVKSQGYPLALMPPAFDPLQSASKKKTDWKQDLLLAHFETEHALSHALDRSLHAYFLPRIAADLETGLSQNIDDPNLLYAMFKGYLAFNDASNTSEATIKAPMEILWDNQFAGHAETLESLKSDLTFALETPIDKLPLDQTLIHRLLEELSHIIPADRAYGLLTLRANTSDFAPLTIETSVGENFNSVFEEKSITLEPLEFRSGVDPAVKPRGFEREIPALYTRIGFTRIFLPEAPGIAKEVSEDNQDLGLSVDGDEDHNKKELLRSLESTYNKDFQEQWITTLKSINIKPFENLVSAINTLDIITSQESPFLNLLHLIHDNTDEVRGPFIDVSTAYAPINHFSSSSWYETNDTLKKLNAYLKSIIQSPDPNKAAFDALVLNMQGQKNPFQDLNAEIQTAPPFIKMWLQEISDNAWHTLVMSAQTYMNTIWNQTVLPEYTSNIEGRYPLSKNDAEQINIDDFNHFFAPEGELDTYFNTYLKFFINTSTTPWSLYQQEGESAEIPDDIIHFFEKVSKLRKDYFPGQTKTANLQLTLMPKNLSESTKAITLSFGDQSITYRHGPQTKSTITWPLPKENQNSSLVLSGFDDNSTERQASGPWSLFEIIRRGDLRPTGEPELYTLTYRFRKDSATFLLSGGNKRILSLGDFEGIEVPKVPGKE